MINIHLDNNPQLAANETFSGLFLSRERIRKRNTAGENAAPPPSNSSLLPQSPSRSPLPLDFKPSDKPPMVLFNEIPNAVNFFYSMDPAVSFTPGHNHSGPSTNDAAYPRGFAPIQHPNPPSRPPYFFHPPFNPHNVYSAQLDSLYLVPKYTSNAFFVHLIENLKTCTTAIRSDVHAVHNSSIGDARNLKKLSDGNPPARWSLNTARADPGDSGVTTSQDCHVRARLLVLTFPFGCSSSVQSTDANILL